MLAIRYRFTALHGVGIDADQSEYALGRRLHEIVVGIASSRTAGCEARENLSRRVSGNARSAAWCIDSLVDRTLKRAIRSPFSSHSSEPFFPHLGRFNRELLGGDSFLPSDIWIHPGLKIGWFQVRKREQQIPQVALGVDGDD